MRRALFLTLVALAPVRAQTSVTADVTVYSAPGGAALGTLHRGTSIRTGATDGAWTSLVLDGWLISTRLTSRIDSLDRVVRGAGTAQLRKSDGPTEDILADLEQGARLKKLGDRNGWTHVRRTVWARTAVLRGGEAAGSRGAEPRAGAPPPRVETPPPAPAARPVAPPTSASGDADGTLKVARETALRSGPNGPERATVKAGATVETLARDAGWVRVRVEGWVPERDLANADSGGTPSLSAADLRANPEAHKGKIVRWEVQAVSVQRADALRRGLAADEQYLLARGPGDEGAILYVALPRNLVDDVRSVPQLSKIIITARVRDGRTPPVGAPLLDLISFSRVQ